MGVALRYLRNLAVDMVQRCTGQVTRLTRPATGTAILGWTPARSSCEAGCKRENARNTVYIIHIGWIDATTAGGDAMNVGECSD